MIELTPDAKVRFEQYLQRLRGSLRGTRAVEADEVEQNVREHVEIALAGVPSPVGAASLADVLEQLGPPEQWLSDEERSAWRRTMDRLIQGPEDWRLPYLSIGLVTLGLITLPIGGFLLLLPAFVVSRAWVAMMEERGLTLDARRWLVLPPIVIVFALFLAMMLIGPILLAVAATFEHDLEALGIPPPGQEASEILAFSGYILSAAGAWWLILSAIAAFLWSPIRSLFAPLLAGARRRHLLVLTVAGAICLASGLALMAAGGVRW